MAHWFHRNPMKPTEFAKFELGKVLSTDSCSKICGELRIRREKLLGYYKNAGNDLTEVTEEFTQYMRLFAGFIVDISNTGSTGEGGAPPSSKLVPLQRFVWGHSMTGKTATELSDSWFEALSQLQCFAIWLMKHAAWVAGKDEVRDSEAKEVLNCLRKAAGIFIFVKSNSNRLTGAEELDGTDFDPKVMNAYELQTTAEAQEVVLARAIELKHNAMLISTLSTHTGNIFAKADMSLSSCKDPTIFERWRMYLQLKHHLYRACAYAFMGDSLLKEDKCGEAVRCCKEGIAEFKIASDFATKYGVATGPGTRIKPESHLFFRRIQPLLERHLEKAERENGFIYHQKVPDERPDLESEASYGIAKSEPFDYPPPAENWTPATYAAFDLSKAAMPDFSKVKKSKTELKPVQEEKIYQTEKDPSTSSGCVIA